MLSELAKRIKNGDEQALYELVRRYEPWLSSVIYNVSGGQLTPQDIEELAADTFIALWQQREKIIPESCKSYLCRIAKNKTRNLMRSNGRHYTEPLTEEEEQQLVYIQSEAENAEISAALKRGLDSLEDKDREILVRRFYHYQPVKHIAERTNLSETAVKSRIHRGLKKLRKKLEEEGFEYE